MDFTKITIETIKHTENKHNMWTGSIFEYIKQSSTCTKGLIGESIIRDYYKYNNHTVNKRTSVGNDIVIDNKKIEIKLSCINNTGYFKWLQIRPDDDFDYLYLVSIYPNNVKVHQFSKHEVLELCNNNILKSQHGGSRNTNYSIKYLGIKESNMPSWFTKNEIK